MELKHELLNAILEYVLNNADGERHLRTPSPEDLKIPQTFSEAEIAYHVQLCPDHNSTKMLFPLLPMSRKR